MCRVLAPDVNYGHKLHAAGCAADLQDGFCSAEDAGMRMEGVHAGCMLLGKGGRHPGCHGAWISHRVGDDVIHRCGAPERHDHRSGASSRLSHVRGAAAAEVLCGSLSLREEREASKNSRMDALGALPIQVWQAEGCACL